MTLLLLLLACWISIFMLDVSIFFPIDAVMGLMPPRWMVLLGLFAVLSFLMGDS